MEIDNTSRDVDDVVVFTPDEIANDLILRGMARDKLPLTRENYIARNWPEEPDEWTAEHESELPEKLQDWAQFDD